MENFKNTLARKDADISSLKKENEKTKDLLLENIKNNKNSNTTDVNSQIVNLTNIVKELDTQNKKQRDEIEKNQITKKLLETKNQTLEKDLEDIKEKHRLKLIEVITKNNLEIQCGKKVPFLNGQVYTQPIETINLQEYTQKINKIGEQTKVLEAREIEILSNVEKLKEEERQLISNTKELKKMEEKLKVSLLQG